MEKTKLDIFYFPYTFPPSPFPISPYSNIRKWSVTGNFESLVTMHSLRVLIDLQGLSISFYVEPPKS